MEYLIGLVSKLTMVVGVLAFLVSVIVQAIKGVSMFKKVPTDFVVLVLSVVLSVVALLAYASYAIYALQWYMVVASIIVGFVVALVAMQGWSKVTELATRFIKKG